MTRPYRLGLIGLGIMGAAMARRLRAEGWDVAVWNLEPERFEAVSQSGARWCETPAEVRRQSDVVMLCILGDAAIESVCVGAGGLAEGEGARALVDFSTTSVATTRTVAAQLGMDWLDVPMSGGPAAAEQGNLTLMAGGDPSTFAAHHELFASLATNCTHMGPLGSGQVAKIINQAVCGANYLILAEALALVERSGIDAALLPKCLQGGMADSVMLQRVYPQMQQRDFDPPRSYARQLNKDLQHVAEFADELGLDLPVLRRAIDQYAAFVSAGNETADSASVSTFYEGK